jgi:hypothetical protein
VSSRQEIGQHIGDGIDGRTGHDAELAGR